MNDDRLDDIPLILETIDSSIWDREIRGLYSLKAKAVRLQQKLILKGRYIWLEL